MWWHRVKAAAAAVAGVAMVAACQGAGESDDEASSRPLKVVGPFEVHSIDPSTSGGFFTRLQVAETLVDADTQGNLVPGLASDWGVSVDQLTWSFTIRPHAVFHDGTAVTGEAVAGSLEVARGKADTPLAAAPVEAIGADADVVRVTLREPFTALPAVLAHTSTQILAPTSYAPDGGVTQVIGSGPYEVKQLRQPSSIEVVASEQWQGEKPAIEEVHYEAVGRPESRALMAESGQAHVTFGMDPVSLQRIKDTQSVEIVSVTLPRTILLKVNAGHEILGDVRVRRALSMALSRESMAAALLRDAEMAATQLFPPSLEDWHHPTIEPLGHDRDRARSLLAEAGWVPGGDGVLSRNGRRFVVALRTFTDRPELPVLATAIQAALNEVGGKVDVRIGNSSDIPAGHKDGSLELALYARNYALVPDPLVTLIQDFAPEGADWGAMGWSNPRLAATLDDMASDADAADAALNRRTVAEILQAELPVIPVAWYRQSAVVDRRVDGFHLDPLERSWLLGDLSWAG